MDRQQLPLTAVDPGLQPRVTEIRMPARSEGHEIRNGREVRA